MIGAELGLTRQVEHDVGVLAERVDRILEPVEVLLEVLDAVEQRAVGAEAERLHDLLQADERGDRGRAGVGRLGRRWIEVDDRDGPLEGGEELRRQRARGDADPT